jgi:hypothetical protein
LLLNEAKMWAEKQNLVVAMEARKMQGYLAAAQTQTQAQLR